MSLFAMPVQETAIRGDIYFTHARTAPGNGRPCFDLLVTYSRFLAYARQAMYSVYLP
jgi:hypothetical protein